MITDAKSIPAGTQINTDICIIGSGAAGIPLALEFENWRPRACILESGGFEDVVDYSDVYHFISRGLPVSLDSRTQGFGGTTRAWAGIWKPHDEIDFRLRPWVKYSGWSVAFQELSGYYDRAAQSVGAFPLEFFNPPLDAKTLEDSTLNTTLVRLMKPEDLDFGRKFKSRFENADNLHVYLRAVVTSFESNPGHTEVQRVRIAAPGKKEFTLTAKIFVLAAGGIENARLLLLSNLGNEHDQVGRYYMDHPKGKVGSVALNHDINIDLNQYFGAEDSAGKVFAGLRLSDRLQEQRQALNSYVQLSPVYEQEGFMGKTARKIFGLKRKMKKIELRNFMEQEPNPDSRITLGEKCDSLGCPRAVIDWQISEKDKITMKTLHEVLRDKLAGLGIGKLESPLLEKNLQDWPIKTDASHHMGTTRMGTDPRTSVVDPNCKIHSVANLYVAGSSVFPTGGYANPTATSIALALRLADHLKNRI